MNKLLATLGVFGSLMNSVAYAADKIPVLVVRKGSADFVEVYEAIKKDISKSIVIKDYVIENNTSFDDFKAKVTSEKPAFLVMMDNKSVQLGIQYNSSVSKPSEKLKGIALMGLNLAATLKGNKEFSGIAYESPAYSLVTQYRYIVSSPLKKVCVAYRKSISQERVNVATDQLKKEGIQLVAMEIEGAGTAPEVMEKTLQDNLAKVTAGGVCDVFWMVLDSVLLNGPKKDWLTKLWKPAAAEGKVPYLVEAEALVKTQIDFGSFAITPNLVDMAGQAVQQIESIVKDGANPEEVGIESVVSVNKILNKSKAEAAGVKLKTENLSGVKVLE